MRHEQVLGAAGEVQQLAVLGADAPEQRLDSQRVQVISHLQASVQVRNSPMTLVSLGFTHVQLDSSVCQ